MKLKNPKYDNHDAFSFLKNIGTQQRRDLKSFIQMPSNPCTKGEIEIAEHILNNTKNGKTCTNKEIMDLFFGDSKVERKSWQRTKHRIQETFLRYFTMRKMEDYPLKGMLLAKIYEEQEHEKKKESAIKLHKKKLQNTLDLDKALYDYWLSSIELYKQEARGNSVEELGDTEQKLDDLYLERKFLYLFEKQNLVDLDDSAASILGEESSFFLSWAKSKIEKTKSVKAIIYYELYLLLLEEEGSEKAKHIEQLIITHHRSIDIPTLEEFCNCLLNYYIKKLNLGKDSYAKSYLDFLSKILELKILYANGELDIVSFKNSIGIALVYNDVEGAWKLLNQHKTCPSYLKGEGKYVFNLMQVTILLNEQKYEEASNIMKPYKLKDILHDLDAQLLQLQIDYSIGKEASSILKKIKMIKIRVKGGGKISAKRRMLYLGFLEALKQLIERQKLDLAVFKGRISTLKKRWLERMVAREMN